jgi:hypothetical protein
MIVSKPWQTPEHKDVGQALHNSTGLLRGHPKFALGQ